ncbi:IMPACT family protein [Gemmatimonadota bacterium]
MKGSKFLAIVEPCSDRIAAEQRLDDLRERYRDASHICWAWRLIPEADPGEASSDAGEPSGTAGVPILSALRSGELWNVLGVVVRWFGGTKLGRGGLIRAYRGAMAVVAEEADIVEEIRRLTLTVTVPVERTGDVHRVLSSFDVTYHDQSVEGSSAMMVLSVRADDQDRLQERIVDATGGKGRVSTPDDSQEG